MSNLHYAVGQECPTYITQSDKNAQPNITQSDKNVQPTFRDSTQHQFSRGVSFASRSFHAISIRSPSGDRLWL